MADIKIINNIDGFAEVCEVLHRSQKAESEATGVLFNTIRLSAEELEREIEDHKGRCVGVFENGRIIGTLCAFEDNKNRWYTHNKKSLEIKYVAVSPESQGKHVGSAMLDYVKSFDNYEILNVSTGEKNKNAIHFYNKNGFILVDISRGPIHNACKLAYWKEGCLIKQRTINSHVLKSRFKCFIKKLLRPKADKKNYQ